MERTLRAALALALISVSFTASAGINTLTSIGPEGGDVSRVIFHPTKPDTAYAVSVRGVYRSVNSGESWELISAFPFGGSADLEIDPADPSRVYLLSFGQATVSNDGGTTFAPLTSLPLEVRNDSRNLEITADGSVTYLTTSDRIFRSTDHGATWSERGKITGIKNSITGFHIDPADANTVYAQGRTSDTTGGLFLSEDGGATWQLADNPDDSNGILGLAFSANPRRLWTARAQNLSVSSDQGRHSSPVPFNDITFAVAVDRTNPDRLYVTSIGGKIYRTDDAALHWTDVTANLLVSQGHGIFLHPQRAGEMYVTSPNNLARTTDGGANWSLRQSGIRAARIMSFSANPSRDRIYLNTSLGGIHYLQGGASLVSEVNNTALEKAMRDYPEFAYINAIHAQEGTPGRLYASLLDDLLRSSDGGNTWERLPYPTLGNVNVYSFASSPRTPNVIFTGALDTTHLQRTVDGGDHWSDIRAGLPKDSWMSLVVAAPSDTPLAYGAVVGTYFAGDPPLAYGVYRWNEAGLTWAPANAGMADAVVRDLAVHPTDPQLVLAVTNKGLMKTTNGGSSWTALPWDGTPFDDNRTHIAFDPLDPRIIYVASDAHLVRSVSGGTTWETLADSALGGTRLATALIADPGSAGTILIGTQYESALHLTIAPDLAVKVTAPATGVGGSALTYELTALNLGPYHATGVQVSAQLPDGMLHISAEPASACTVVGSKVNCLVDVVRAGFSSQITLHAIPSSSTGAFAVTAKISGAQEDAVADNNSVTSTTTLEMQSDLSVTASGSATAQVGAVVTYSVNVSNAGPNIASSTQLSYQLASGLSNASATSTRGVCTSSASQVICNLGNLASTESAAITINATASTAGKQDSTATVSSGSTDATPANNSAANSTTVSAATPSGGGSSGGGGSTGGSSSTASSGGGGGGALSPDLLVVLALLILGQLASRSRSLRRARDLYLKSILATIALRLPVLVCTLLAACGGGGGEGPAAPPTPTPQSQTITFTNAGPISGAVGTTVTNTASGFGGTGAITYASSNTATATVNATTGVVTLIAAGSTTITATKAADSSYSAATATYTITATPGAQPLAFGQTGALNVLLGSTTANAASGGSGTGAITYASSNTNAVTVDANGAATAVGVGTALVTATKAADANYPQVQASYTINSQTANKVSAFIGSTGSDVILPASANGKQFGRARVADCTLTDTVATCATAELNPVNGASVSDTRATLTTPAYYAIVNGSTVGTPIDVRADRFSNRIGHAVISFKNRYWVIGGAEPIWPNDATNYLYTPKADVWSSADGKSWKLESADAGFGGRWFHQAVVFNNRIWILSGGSPPPNAVPFFTDVWSSADGVTWQREATDAGLPWWANSLYVVVFNNQMLAVSGGQSYTSTNGVFARVSTFGAVTGSTTTGRQNGTLTVYNNQLWFIAGRDHLPLSLPDNGNAMNDVWKSADGVTWNLVTLNAPFAPRYQHASYVANGKLWVVGGRAATGGVPGNYSGDAWSTTDGIAWTKENLNTLASGFLMPIVQETGKVTVIGGLQAGFTNHVWQTTDGASWSELSTYAPFSPRLTSGTEFNGQMWVIGGQATAGSAGTSVSNDIWRTSDGLNWTRVTPTGPLFSPRDRHAVIAFNNKLWVIGGWDETPGLGGTGTRFNDVWSSPDGVNWTQQAPAGGTIFSPRFDHATVVYGGKLWVIGGDVDGGSSTEAVVNDVWSTTDGTTWVRATASAAFAARTGHSVAVLNNAMWLVGGDDINAATADVWKSTDGIAWSQQTPAGTSFSARTRHRSAVLNGRMYIIAGTEGPQFGRTLFNDVWSTADGTNWRRDTAAAAFPAREFFATFVHNNELWLSGGLAAGVFNDVWRSSDGVNWRVGFSRDITAP